MTGRLVIGAALVIIGVVWIGQGIGVIGGSFMTGDPLWAVIGTVLSAGAAIGLWLSFRPRAS